jgi:hypothetical protein
MRFCPLCGSYHDPDVSCVDRAGSILKDAGIERAQMRRKEFKKMVKKLNRTMVVVLLIFGLLLLSFVLMSVYISK